ncbi:MAG: maltose alpha-D-glucosyltransferase [Elusimicrobiota bacterium]
MSKTKAARLEREPLWYKDAVIYELHVRSFCDGNNDGVGDFRGLSSKLDYLKDLGVTALWLLPFYPSPLKDDGYDIADYTSIHPSYGTLKDFKIFLAEAHRRGLRVITELVINHTSEQHPWFQKARRAKPGSPARKYYVWSKTPEKYQEARIIFKDYEHSNWAWDPVAEAYYWHRFYSHQPDLNFENPHVRKAVLKVVDFWMGMGVDGMRLDAVPYLFEKARTDCENLPETHAYLKQLRKHVDEKFRDRMLLAEANQWPDDAVAYFGDGDESHVCFHFPLMPRLFISLRMEDRHPIVDILEQTPPIPESCQWALFLRNHDELTLEMVTDEDRDYMYRTYANDPQMRINLGIRRRLAPLLGGNRRKIELLKGLLFTMPGTPVLYYGDELGMGDNIYLGDRNGVRTPMQWSADRNAGFSRAPTQRLFLPLVTDAEYHYEARNVEDQQRNPQSLLWWTKRLIALRKRCPSLSRGTIEFLRPENRKVLAFVRRLADETILVVANLSRFVQCVELDLSQFKDMVPVEMFGQTEFPPIGELPYFVTLGPHSFYLFSVEKIEAAVPFADAGKTAGSKPPELACDGFGSLFAGKGLTAFERILPGYLNRQRWFGAKSRGLKSVRVSDVIAMPRGPRAAPAGPGAEPARLALVEAVCREGEPDTYILPLALAWGERARGLAGDRPKAVIATLRHGEDEGILYDASLEREFCLSLLSAMEKRRRLKGTRGSMLAVSNKAFRALRGDPKKTLEPELLGAEQSNTSIVFGDRFIMKIIRRLERGVSPELEIGRFLARKGGFPHAAPLAGWLEYQEDGRTASVAVLQGAVKNAGDAWRFSLDALGQYFERVLASFSESERPGPQSPPEPARPLPDALFAEAPTEATALIGPYLDEAVLLGRRTAEMHVALSSGDDEAFMPEPFTDFFRKSVYHGMVSQASEALRILRQRLRTIPEDIRGDAVRVAGMERAIRNRFREIRDRRITAMLTRCHGDYHLGQVLRSGNDFVIIDFEGEPARSVTTRRLKRSPLKDVAGMLRSFDYAAYAALTAGVEGAVIRPEDAGHLMTWARFWSDRVGAAFLSAYREAAGGGSFLPKDLAEFKTLLDLHLLEKAFYELRYEINNRPAWAHIPVRGILRLMGMSDEDPIDDSKEPGAPEPAD